MCLYGKQSIEKENALIRPLRKTSIQTEKNPLACAGDFIISKNLVKNSITILRHKINNAAWLVTYKFNPSTSFSK